MHPILAHGRRLALYLVLWSLVGVYLAALVPGLEQHGWRAALTVSMPLATAYAFVCLSSWYVARGLPLGSAAPIRTAITVLSAATFSSIAWLGLARLWIAILARRTVAVPRPGDVDTLILTIGVLLYLLSLAVSYLAAGAEQARDAERRGLHGQVLAREAELRSLRAQIDPHFLFNSLHSISALTAVDPPGARRMSILLGDFLRESLALGSKDRIPLGRELQLASRYLEIERVRFGDRLRAEVVSTGADDCPVAPLLLQPLVENAVTHGIAQLVDGGSIRVAASRSGTRLTVVVENPCDPDRPRRTGTGVGLSNVRARLRALYGDDAHLSAVEDAGAWRVTMTMPVEEGGG